MSENENEEVMQEDGPEQESSVPAQSTFYPGGYPEVEPGQPMTLDSLQDPPPGTKPRYPYSTLIRYAIKGSPHGKLLLEDIYFALEARFPYFRTAPSGWKNSVRHNLSLNPCFVKVPRPLTDRGKGSYWALDETVDPRTGVHRVRKKRNERGVEASGASSATADQYSSGHYPYMSGMVMQPEQAPATYGYGFHTTFMPPEMRMAMGGDPNDPNAAQHDWRALWLTEITQIEDFMKEHEEKGDIGPEWYKMMYHRTVRAFAPEYHPAMYGAHPPHGMPSHPPPSMDGNEAGPSGEKHDGADERDEELEEEDGN